MANQNFTYNWDFPGTTVSQGGLTQLSGNNGNATGFATPILSSGGSVVNSFRVFTDTPAAVPEPSTWLLLGTGLAAAAARRRFAKRP